MLLIEFHQVGPEGLWPTTGPVCINPECVAEVSPAVEVGGNKTTIIFGTDGGRRQIWGDYRDVAKRLSPGYEHSPNRHH